MTHKIHLPPVSEHNPTKTTQPQARPPLGSHPGSQDISSPCREAARKAGVRRGRAMEGWRGGFIHQSLYWASLAGDPPASCKAHPTSLIRLQLPLTDQPEIQPEPQALQVCLRDLCDTTARAGAPLSPWSRSEGSLVSVGQEGECLTSLRKVPLGTEFKLLQKKHTEANFRDTERITLNMMKRDFVTKGKNKKHNSG